MFNCIEDVKNASRSELVQYLESWGTACYDDESTSLLRDAAIDTFETEGCQNDEGSSNTKIQRTRHASPVRPVANYEANRMERLYRLAT